mgnify:CR=1 FL=1|jgi:hypothetical protein|tara:strand:+ start:222 stop:737 length:516 start_codon:yes stop_codon:yes gene_type:complete
MSELDSEMIKDFCEEALEITDQYGAEEGLSFLIGNKFFEVLRNLREIQNKSKFLFPFEGDPSFDFALEQRKRLNSPFENTQNFDQFLQKIERLKETSEFFVKEIKVTFDSNDIQDYLSSYPILGVEDESLFESAPDKDFLSLGNALDEIRDIFYIEEMKKMFLGIEKDKAI